SSCRLGSYSVKAGATKMIDMDAYINNDTDKINTVAVSELEDEAVYTAYVFGKSNAGYYRYAVFFDGLYSVRPETQIAVVKKVNGLKDAGSGDMCNSYTVYRAGEETELLIEQGTVRRSDNTAAYIGEGSVIAYMVGSDGYAETDDVYVLYTPQSTYYGNLSSILSNNDFCGSQLDWVKQVTSGKNAGKYEIAYRGRISPYKDVFAYVGVVYRKQNNVLELFTKQSGNISSINAVADLSLGSATGTYTFDYCQRADKGVRLEVGTANQSNSVYNPIFVNDKNDVCWDYEDIEPMTAFVKEVDGEVTDVVLFMPE
ncbi:MAG: hypothetical protein IJH94_02135, partial [Clostridia bacterium]|nr:hypothetical protein [Clostridia bacterium]